MNLEAAVVVGYEGEAVYWHLPENRSPVALQDSEQFWHAINDNRRHIQGVAHSHPGSGLPMPSWEDITTFAGVEQGIGRRLVWWIISSNDMSIVLWCGPERYDYEVLQAGGSKPKWLEELRRHSKYKEGD